MQHIICHFHHYKSPHEWLYVHNLHLYSQAHSSPQTEQKPLWPCIYVGSKVFSKLDHCRASSGVSVSIHIIPPLANLLSGSLGRRESSLRSFHTPGSPEGSLPLLVCMLWPHTNSPASLSPHSHSLCHWCLFFEHAISSLTQGPLHLLFPLSGMLHQWHHSLKTTFKCHLSREAFLEYSLYQMAHLALLIVFIWFIFPQHLWTSVPVVNWWPVFDIPSCFGPD